MAEPRIRFKRDDGHSFPDWESHDIGYYLDIRDQKEVPSEEAPLMAFIAYQGVADKGERYDRSFLVKSDDKKYKRTEYNDFIYSSNNLDVGSIGLNKYGSAVISVVYEIFKCKNNCNPDCINALLQMPQNIAKMLKYRQGALYGQYKIPAENFLSIKIDAPCREEQDKIADFLSSVDEVITASEEEVANLETQKKAVMKKIFSQEVRFKKADGSDFPEWEEQSFENAFEPLNNNTFSRDMLNYDFGTALNIHYGDILVKYGDVCDIQAEGLPYVNEGISVSKYAHLQDGDIILADTAEDEAVGKAVEIINVGDSVVVSGLHTMVCRPKQKYSPKYLGYYMNSPAFHDQLKPYMQGIKVTSIGRKNIKDVTVMYPSDLEEQRLIADFLSDFDEAIAAAKKELELWKELKKGLLQQMFV